MKHLVLTPDRNTQGNDYSGAFKPEAERYARFYTGQGDTVVTHRVDVSEHSPKKRLQVLSYLAAEGPIDRLALFCHGWSGGSVRPQVRGCRAKGPIGRGRQGHRCCVYGKPQGRTVLLPDGELREVYDRGR